MRSTSERDFYRYEATGGMLVLTAGLVALVLANFFPHNGFGQLRNLTVTLGIGELGVAKPLHALIGDIVFAVLFLVYGLKIKARFGRSATRGTQSPPPPSPLAPLLIAAAAILFPAIVLYGALGDAVAGGQLNGGTLWVLPAGTDLAIVLAIMSSFSARLDDAARAFMTEIVIIGAIVAVLAISIAQIGAFSIDAALGFAVMAIVMLVLRLFAVQRTEPYLVAGVGLWLVLQSTGFHAPLAGVLTAAAIPILHPADRADGAPGPAMRLAAYLHPVVPLVLLPVFMLFAAGISFAELGAAAGDSGRVIDPFPLPMPLAAAVALALIVGKQAGFFLAALLLFQFGYGLEIKGRGRLLYGLAVLSGSSFALGLGFTGLAGLSAEANDAVRLGIIVGSLIAVFWGAAILRCVKIQSAETAAHNIDRDSGKYGGVVGPDTDLTKIDMAALSGL